MVNLNDMAPRFKPLIVIFIPHNNSAYCLVNPLIKIVKSKLTLYKVPCRSYNIVPHVKL